MKVAAMVLATIVAGSAHATFRHGDELLQECESGDVPFELHCLGYLKAVSDRVEDERYYAKERGYPDPQICLHENISAKQLMDTWINWANANVELLDHGAASLVRRALASAWPCI